MCLLNFETSLKLPKSVQCNDPESFNFGDLWKTKQKNKKN